MVDLHSQSTETGLAQRLSWSGRLPAAPHAADNTHLCWEREGVGGRVCWCVSIIAHTHTRRVFFLFFCFQTDRVWLLLPCPLSSSPNVYQQAPALALAHCVGCWRFKANWEMKIKTGFWNDENIQMGRGSIGCLWLCVQRTPPSPVPDTPSWIPVTPPQTCLRLEGWGEGWEGGEGFPRGLYSLVTAKRLPLPEGCHGNAIWFLQQCQSTPPHPPHPPPAPHLSHTSTRTHLLMGLCDWAITLGIMTQSPLRRLTRPRRIKSWFFWK